MEILYTIGGCIVAILIARIASKFLKATGLYKPYTPDFSKERQEWESENRRNLEKLKQEDTNP